MNGVSELYMYGTHPCIQQDFPQQRLNVIVCSPDDDWQLVSAVHVIYLGVGLRRKMICKRLRYNSSMSSSVAKFDSLCTNAQQSNAC